MRLLVLLFAIGLVLSAAPQKEFAFPQAQGFLKSYCVSCHQGPKPSAGFDAAKLNSMQTMMDNPRNWGRMLNRVRDSEMPPKGAPAPAMEAREAFVHFVETTMKTAACADGISPRPAMIRRLNRAEYSSTVRDLLNIHINAGRGLPADGAGGEGFDNAAETLFLSPMHAEKYLQAAREALAYGAKDPKSRERFLIAAPSDKMTAEEAGQKIITTFLPRAFRRPATAEENEQYVALFTSAYKRTQSFESSVLHALQGVLIAPQFLFRAEEPNPGTGPRLLDDFALATRLSYFLWGTMPDEALFKAAQAGELRDEQKLSAQAVRMMKDARVREFAEQFVEQWLLTRELGRDIKPDEKLFPAYYDQEIQSAIRYEPILFFQELVNENLSLLNLIDSRFSVMSNKLARHYGIKPAKALRQQPVVMDLPEDTHRGGVLGMAAVLAVSSYPNRTSPVLRGKWVLEALLGTPPPPPPPNVPQLPEHKDAAPQTLRERLTQHRANPVCATCHNRIDPLGFGLENYDVLGRWRDEDSKKPIDAKGVLPDGARFDGPEEMKQILMQQRDLLVRNLANKMLGYALGRGLTLEDHCSVDRIVDAVKTDNYSTQRLILEIVRSVPFRYQMGTSPNEPAIPPAAKTN
ncbi:MAG TPA: DUF1592 domain-containing protein [Bryobacteraceae bacterium]|nr:DUF1592 domain-containing protein [Bryobacteraceae bacterium]